MNKTNKDILNILAGSFCLSITIFALIATIPMFYLAARYGGRIFLGLICGILLVVVNLIITYFVFKSVNEKTMLYTKEGKQIFVRKAIFLMVAPNLVLFVGMKMMILITIGRYGFFYYEMIIWIAGTILYLIAGFIYRDYTQIPSREIKIPRRQAKKIMVSEINPDCPRCSTARGLGLKQCPDCGKKF